MLRKTPESAKHMKEESAVTVMTKPIETQEIVRLAPVPVHPRRLLARAVKEKARKEKAKEREAKHRLPTERRYHATSSYVASAAKVIRATSSTM